MAGLSMILPFVYGAGALLRPYLQPVVDRQGAVDVGRAARVGLCAVDGDTHETSSDDLGPLPPVGETLQQLNPDLISVIPIDLQTPVPVPLVDPTATFVQLFRSCTPYIKMHQGSTVVIHVASEVSGCSHNMDAMHIHDCRPWVALPPNARF